MKYKNKINELSSLYNYWGNVRKITKNLKSDYHLREAQITAEKREEELKEKFSKSIIVDMESAQMLGWSLKEYKERTSHSNINYYNDKELTNLWVIATPDCAE